MIRSDIPCPGGISSLRHTKQKQAQAPERRREMIQLKDEKAEGKCEVASQEPDVSCQEKLF